MEDFTFILLILQEMFGEKQNGFRKRHRKSSKKKVFLKTSQCSQQNFCVEVSFQ